MKLKLHAAIALILVSALSCQDEIFYTIEKEVKLKDASFYGVASNIVRVGDYLYTAAGDVYYKRVDETTENSWHRYPSPPGDQAIMISCDGENIYAMTTTWGDDKNYGEDGYEIEKSRDIYYTAGIVETKTTETNEAGEEVEKTESSTSEWKKADLGALRTIKEVGNSSDTSATSRMLYDRYAEKAYLRLYDAEKTVTDKDGNESAGVWGLYELSGGAAGAEVSGADSAMSVANGEFSTAYCIAYDGEKYYTPSGTATLGGTETVGVAKSALSIGVTKTRLVVGTTSGIQLYDKEDLSAEIKFSNNADSTLSKYYEVSLVYVVDEEAEDDTKTEIYAALDFDGTSGNALQNHRCLWAYYPWRGSWNRD